MINSGTIGFEGSVERVPIPFTYIKSNSGNVKRCLLLPIFVLLKNSDLLAYPSTIPPLGQPFTVLQVVDSSNNYAMAQIEAGRAAHGSTFLALEQTAGKGQRGKSWETTAGENILMSVVIQPFPLTISQQPLLSFAIALGCYDFYKKYAGEEDTRIKWPNDLYWQDRKAGGILIESIIGGNLEGSGKEGAAWKWAIAGIGININQVKFAPGLANPVSLKQITGKQWEPVELALELCQHLEKRFQQLLRQPKSDLLEDYNACLYKRNRSIRLRKQQMVFTTDLVGVNENGQLLTRDSIERVFDHGEVEWVF